MSLATCWVPERNHGLSLRWSSCLWWITVRWITGRLITGRLRMTEPGLMGTKRVGSRGCLLGMKGSV